MGALDCDAEAFVTGHEQLPEVTNGVSKKKPKKFPQELFRVAATAGQQGVDLVAEWAFQPVAVHAVIGFQVPDDGFDSRPSPSPFPRLCITSAFLLTRT